MNIYNLHSNPEELLGFDIVPHKVPELAYALALDNPKLRPKLGPTIMKDPKWAYRYAYNALQHRWPEAEPYIMKDGYYAARYAMHILRDRWPEAEPYIATNYRTWYDYSGTFGL